MKAPGPPRYTPCVSPRTFKYIAKGKWEFYLRGLLDDGSTLPSATSTFTID